MPELPPPFTLTLPSDLRMLSVARAFVDAVCQTCALDRATTHAIILATGEAVTNVIRHAHCDCPGATVQVQVHVGPDFLEVDVLDEGEPFNLEAVPHLEPGELRVGGRGVYLMRALMDELSCGPRDGRGHARGNVLRMVKRWTP